MEHTVTSPEEFSGIARAVLAGLPKEREAAAVVALYGELGAGKTTFTRALARELGIAEEVRSPTFLLIKQLPIIPEKYGFTQLVHIDAYRTDTTAELETLSFGKLIADPENIIAIEWAEKVEGVLPDSMVQIYFDIVDETTRKVEVEQ